MTLCKLSSELHDNSADEMCFNSDIFKIRSFLKVIDVFSSRSKAPRTINIFVHKAMFHRISWSSKDRAHRSGSKRSRLRQSSHVLIKAKEYDWSNGSRINMEALDLSKTAKSWLKPKLHTLYESIIIDVWSTAVLHFVNMGALNSNVSPTTL